MIERLTLNNIDLRNIILDVFNANFYIILKKYLSNDLFLDKNSKIVTSILNTDTTLIKLEKNYLIKNNIAILIILENKIIFENYKYNTVLIDSKDNTGNSNIILFKENIFLIKSLSGYGSHLMHVSIYRLLKTQLTKDDCLELFNSEKFMISNYIEAVEISQSTFDRSRKSYE